MKDFSIVFQDVVLFNNTIMENIRVGRKVQVMRMLLLQQRLQNVMILSKNCRRVIRR